jgi:hypothetical protein
MRLEESVRAIVRICDAVELLSNLIPFIGNTRTRPDSYHVGRTGDTLHACDPMRAHVNASAHSWKQESRTLPQRNQRWTLDGKETRVSGQPRRRKNSGFACQ